MKQTVDFMLNELKNQSIRLSQRRLKILEYMCHNQNHPTVDQIYIDILKEVPNLSKTTIYNTLHILVEAGLIRVISIDDNETRYDIMTENHGHFKCDKCGVIHNFRIDPKLLGAEELSGFKVVDRNVYFKGVCPKCLKKINNKN